MVSNIHPSKVACTGPEPILEVVVIVVLYVLDRGQHPNGKALEKKRTRDLYVIAAEDHDQPISSQQKYIRMYVRGPFFLCVHNTCV